MNTAWNNLLLRQLKRCGLSTEKLPTTVAEWLAFLQCVNRSYIEADQEHYLLERSMLISSREMSELNEKLEKAQQLVGLGYWDYNTIKDKIFWSDELRFFFGYDAIEPPPTLETFLEYTHEEDRKLLIESVNEAATIGKAYDIEFRVKHKKTHEYRWFRSICRPHNPTGEKKQFSQFSGVVLDITPRKIIEGEMAQLNTKLLASARSVGMAEVATDVLHNVGNVLNSVNVSIGLLHEKLRKPRVKKIRDVAIMLQLALEKTNFANIANDKEKLLPGYLMMLAQTLEDEHAMMNKEINDIDTHVQHINDIVSSQQSLAKVAGMMEKVLLPELMELALEISFPQLDKNDVDIKKTFQAVPEIVTDKSKVLQILVNVLQNARDSVLSANPPIKTIIVSVGFGENETVEILVQDNGLGISPENITLIFAFGFTTKSDGHGFGLHMSALAAKELGGGLFATSAGLGEGATFHLSLPISSATTFNEVTHEQNDGVSHHSN
jgi:signal transduction histidine kinase/PAS domain-containing protein